MIISNNNIKIKKLIENPDVPIRKIIEIYIGSSIVILYSYIN